MINRLFGVLFAVAWNDRLLAALPSNKQPARQFGLREFLCAFALLALVPSASVAATKCNPGEVAVSQNKCIPAGASDCGNGTYCPHGNYCANDGHGCVPDGAAYCGGGHFCRQGRCAVDHCDTGAEGNNAPTCGPGYHLIFPGGYGSRPECQPNQPGESGSGVGNQSTITGGQR